MFRAIVFVAMLLAPTFVWAQGESFVMDDRYAGYPKELQPPKELPPLNLAECKAGEFYDPDDTHLLKYMSRVKMAKDPRILQDPECRIMLTVKGWRWVMRPVGTAIAVDEQGRDLFDLECGNPTPFGVPILPPPTVAAVVPVLPLDFREKLVTGVYIPKYEEEEDDDVVVAAVVPAPSGNICSGKKGFLCAGIAACIVGSAVNRTLFCGLSFGDDDEPTPDRPATPEPVRPPPPSITPPKPPG